MVSDNLWNKCCQRKGVLAMQRAFVDVRIFYPFAQSYRNQALSSTFRSMERAKKEKYNSKIMENEHGTFTPLISQ